jgi:ABC-type sugar transport system permease subunit
VYSPLEGLGDYTARKQGMESSSSNAGGKSLMARLLTMRLSMRAKEEIAGYICISPWLVGFIIFTAGAMGYSPGLSFFESDMFTGSQFVGLDNYTKLIDDRRFQKGLVVTSYYTFGTVPLRIILLVYTLLIVRSSAMWVYYE